MAYKYQKLMEEWEVTMDHPILDKAFVTKVNDFHEKIQKKSLTEEEIGQTDDELCDLFTSLHKLELIDSPEVQKQNRRAEIAEAKNEIALAETIAELDRLQDKFDSIPELQPFIQKRKEKLQEAIDEQQKNQFVQQAKEEIEASDFSALPQLLEKYKEHPSIIDIINEKAEQDPSKKQKTKRQLLSEAKKREWSYDDLRRIGIEPTGDDMEIEGVYLQRQYLYKIYLITKVDGQKI